MINYLISDLIKNTWMKRKLYFERYYFLKKNFLGILCIYIFISESLNFNFLGLRSTSQHDTLMLVMFTKSWELTIKIL